MPHPDFGLGRIASEDERDRLFLMQSVVEAPPEVRTYRYWWPGGWWGDQGLSPHCVAFSLLHYLEDGPLTQAPRKPGTGPIYDPRWLYCEAQKVDEWDGDCATRSYDGTSVRGGAKVLQRLGAIEAYYWAWELQQVIEALLYKGPVVVGTNWYEGMFFPDSEGLIKISGRLAGGHAYLLNGVNVSQGLLRIKNSWGRSYGRRGHAYIGFEEMARLIREDGEACIATEKVLDA